MAAERRRVRGDGSAVPQCVALGEGGGGSHKKAREQPVLYEAQGEKPVLSPLNLSSKLPSVPDAQRRQRTAFDDDEDYKLDELPAERIMDSLRQLTTKPFDPDEDEDRKCDSAGSEGSEPDEDGLRGMIP